MRPSAVTTARECRSESCNAATTIYRHLGMTKTAPT